MVTKTLLTLFYILSLDTFRVDVYKLNYTHIHIIFRINGDIPFDNGLIFLFIFNNITSKLRSAR